MIKPFKFRELKEEAKRKAAEEIEELESPHQDWEIESQMISEDLNYKIHEFKLDGADIPWGYDYRADLDLSSIRTTDEFYKSVLTKEQYGLMLELEEISHYGLEHVTFDREIDFGLEGDFSDVDPETAIEFINEYGDEDDNAEIAFASLLLEDGEDDELSEEYVRIIASTVEPLAEALTEELTELIYPKLEEVRETLYKLVDDAFDYYYSSDYYYDYLNDCEGCYYEEKYRFNEEGDIVSINDEILDEYIEIYNMSDVNDVAV